MTQVRRRFARRLAVPAFLLVVSVLHLSAAPAATAPLKGDWQVPAAGEAAAIEGSISVATSVSVVDGITTVSYTCAATGHAKGKSSGADFVIGGAGAGTVPVTQSLHTDIPIACTVALTAGATDQHFRLTLQATLDDSSAPQSLVVRTLEAF
jgi:hypothetical protein